MTLYIFNSESKTADWYTLDDVVMGGNSNGSFSINAEGFGVFKGEISLENNGGFSSVRHDCKRKNTEGFTHFIIRVKGDGNPYQFRVKSDKTNRYSYVATFQTTESWETIKIAFSYMPAVFRGRKLDMPNFSGSTIEEIGFLIGNKKPQKFKLEIDSIILSK
ncbi:CIA30 family protein [Bizionia argentinensis JUB59]|uniref:CIA30 family protein n=1 Tax=Bizionia argentinensis JUB59 TaxID=1046627 RepID=G2EG59_9FLAO|nr:CIA30 family protein [Bizionia argentinensis]EGV42569.1 CIA30 family protein [Bizionia argentinensis JUB59]